jgi:hypothetical protein
VAENVPESCTTAEASLPAKGINVTVEPAVVLLLAQDAESTTFRSAVTWWFCAKAGKPQTSNKKMRFFTQSPPLFIDDPIDAKAHKRPDARGADEQPKSHHAFSYRYRDVEHRCDEVHNYRLPRIELPDGDSATWFDAPSIRETIMSLWSKDLRDNAYFGERFVDKLSLAITYHAMGDRVFDMVGSFGIFENFDF